MLVGKGGKGRRQCTIIKAKLESIKVHIFYSNTYFWVQNGSIPFEMNTSDIIALHSYKIC